MGLFFIHTETGRIATQTQLLEAGIATAAEPPTLPWHRIQGTGDATTLWYAALRKRVKGVYIGTLVIRHSDHYASLLSDGWEEVEVAQIGVADEADQAM